MAYIGRRPQYGAFEKQTITADSSTTTFTLDYVIGSSSSILVSIAGVPQEPGVAYTLTGGGASIVFAEAPTTGDTVFIVFLGVAMETLTVGTGTITSQTALTAGASADNLLIYDDSATALKKISLSTLFTDPLDVIGSTPTNIITDRGALGEQAAEGDQLLIYDTSAGAIKKVNKSNIATVIVYPTITSISQNYIAPATATSFDITGTNFSTGCKVSAEKSDGSFTEANSLTRNSATSLTVNFTLATEGDYFLRVENNDGQAVRSSTALLGVNNDPTWTTASGSLGSAAAATAGSFTAVATETDSGPISYALVSGSFPGGYALTVNDSIATISGTETGSTAETTYTFSLEATDDESQKATRSFSITITHGGTGGGQFN